MNILRTIFGRPAKMTKPSELGGFNIIYGGQASLEANRRRPGLVPSNPITLIEKTALPGPIDIVIAYKLRCRKHGTIVSLSTEANFSMVQQLGFLPLPCHCRADIQMFNGTLIQIFMSADSKFDLAIQDIKEGKLISRNMPFQECPTCHNAVQRGSSEHFDIYQCVQCGTRYCYRCDNRKGCPQCQRHTDRICVGSVSGTHL